MGGGETHAQQRRDRRHAPHELREIDIARPIGIDVLTEQRDLAVAVLEEAPGLGDDGLRITAPFAAPRIGNHAVGAEVVASAHDAHEGAHAVAVEAHRSDLGIGLLSREQHIDPLAAGLGLAHQARQVAVGIRPGHHIDGIRSLDKLLLQALGHAADDADHQTRTFAAVAFHLGQAPPDPLLGVVADRAGVDQDDVRLGDPLRIDIALLLHECDDDLRIADVHLAAVGFDKEFAPLARERPQCIHVQFQIQIQIHSFIPPVSSSCRGTA